MKQLDKLRKEIEKAEYKALYARAEYMYALWTSIRKKNANKELKKKYLG